MPLNLTHRAFKICISNFPRHLVMAQQHNNACSCFKDFISFESVRQSGSGANTACLESLICIELSAVFWCSLRWNIVCWLYIQRLRSHAGCLCTVVRARQTTAVKETHCRGQKKIFWLTQHGSIMVCTCFDKYMCVFHVDSIDVVRRELSWRRQISVIEEL